MTEEKPKQKTEEKAKVETPKVKADSKIVETPKEKVEAPKVKDESKDVKKLADYKEKSEDKTEKIEDKKDKPEDKKDKAEDKVDKKKKVKAPEIKKKFIASANGRSLPVSKKQCMYICSFINGKSIDAAIADLGQVIKMKKAVPFKGEIPHRKGKGMMSGRYPVKASKLFIDLLKGLKGNVLVNQMELEKTRICWASASWAPRPIRRGGREAKRTHVMLKARELAPKGAKK